jgi:hypothetical protein
MVRAQFMDRVDRPPWSATHTQRSGNLKKLLVIGLVFVIALTVVLSVVTAGCGSSDTTETTIATDTTVVDDTATTTMDDTATTVAPVEDVTTTVAQYARPAADIQLRLTEALWALPAGPQSLKRRQQRGSEVRRATNRGRWQSPETPEAPIGRL